MMLKKWLLIAISSLFYSLAFIFSDYLWWLSLIFFIPLFLIAIDYTTSFKEGFFWGFCSLSIIEFGIFYSLIKMSQYSKFGILFIAIIVLIVQAILAGLWFYFSESFTQFIKIKKSSVKLLIWIITTWLYIYIVDNFLFLIFCSKEGLFLIHPLLPLAQYPPFLSLLPLFGKKILTLLLIISSALFTLAIKEKTLEKKTIYIFLASLPWITSYIYTPDKIEKPKFLSKIVYVPESFYNRNNFNKTIDEVTKIIKNILIKNNQIEIILFPESSLYLCNLQEIQNQLYKWSFNNLNKKIHIILGALRKTKDKIFNTAYWIYDGKIQNWHDKKHTLFLTEKLPSWAHFNFLYKSYFSDKPFINQQTKKRKLFKISKEVNFIPYICSEIFFNDNYDFTNDKELGKQSNLIILSLCNDTWVYINYIKKLMAIVNKFRSIQWQIDIIYISYSNGYFFTKQGQSFLMPKSSDL